jgi:hypothetical protein
MIALDITTTCNEFLMIAEARNRSGEDMEEVARRMAKALQAIIIWGLGEGCDVTKEFDRLRSE